MAILDRVPSPSKLEPQFLLIRSIVLARQGHVPEARAGWQRLLAFMLSQRGETDEALAILDRMPSPSNLEPQYLMVRAIVLAGRGDVAGGRRLWRQLLDYTRQPADAPPEQVLRQFMITPAVIARSAATLRDSGVVASKPAG
jgi:hypothetical protein